jgi:Serine carboxypeptidase S28
VGRTSLNLVNSRKFTPESIAEKIEVINMKNGGLQPNFTNVYSTHGSHDPWRYVGLRRRINGDSPFRMIGKAAHVADLYSIDDEMDSASMKETKQHLVRWIKALVNEEKAESDDSDGSAEESSEEAESEES